MHANFVTFDLTFALRIIGCFVLQPSVCSAADTQNVVFKRRRKAVEVLFFIERDFFCFSEQIEVPKEFCCDALNR